MEKIRNPTRKWPVRCAARAGNDGAGAIWRKEESAIGGGKGSISNSFNKLFAMDRAIGGMGDAIGGMGDAIEW